MLLPIRRPVRPEPLPLDERTRCDLVNRIALVWLSVRHKRSRAPMPLRPFRSFPRKREPMNTNLAMDLPTVVMDPRLRGDDER